jgi:(E)-4-hydroxy-3-methylbut-2-enyl-diphosphate synthase
MAAVHNRLITREVKVGDIAIGGKNPIRIQSMTNINTLNTDAVVEQTMNLVKVGCELVRITAPGIAEAENLNVIKKLLLSKGFRVPIIADIHFSAKAAEIAAQFVDKVRINPGNYADKKQFKQHEYTELEYQFELERIYSRIKPLIEICKKNGTAMRIGVNHGSLSDRIISRYGDTPMGMAMSAVEYANICQSLGFENIIFSMKSSDVKVMIYSTRLLVHLFNQKGVSFPIHVGVTEAGAGADGRIRSAAGIGALLSEGIGDTIRVSLTESPMAEIPVAKEIVAPYSIENTVFVETMPFAKKYYPHHNPFEYSIRASFANSTRAIIISDSKNIKTEDISTKSTALYPQINIDTPKETIQKAQITALPIVISSTVETPIQKVKDFIASELFDDKNPLLFKRDYLDLNSDEIFIKAAADIGALAADGFVNGIEIIGSKISIDQRYKLSLDILQSCGLRYYKTEIISCPSCGRTNYNIEELLEEVKARLSHFEGLKIAVMGCVVNGPGEMSDADYGLVGAGEGTLWLYKGKTPILKHIEQSQAVEKLIEVITADLILKK